MTAHATRILIWILFTGTFASDIKAPMENSGHLMLVKIANHELPKDLPTKEFLDWADTVPQMYDSIFSYQIVAKQLKSDLSNSIKTVRDVFVQDPEGNAKLTDLIRREIKTRGLESVRRETSATKGLLWMKRAMEYIMVFLQKVSRQTEKTVSQCAQETYAEVLKPYHGLLTSTFVGLVMSWAPSKTDLMKNFGLTEETFASELSEFLKGFSSVVETMGALLEEMGANFPDKV